MSTPESDLLDDRGACRVLSGDDNPFSTSTLYRGIRAGRYPRPIKVGPGTSRWLRSELEEAKRRLIAERDARAA